MSNDYTSQDKNFVFIQTIPPSRFKKVASIHLSRSQQTIKIVGLDGELLGLARCEEIIDLLNDDRATVDIVVYNKTPEATR